MCWVKRNLWYAKQNILNPCSVCFFVIDMISGIGERRIPKSFFHSEPSGELLRDCRTYVPVKRNFPQMYCQINQIRTFPWYWYFSSRRVFFTVCRDYRKSVMWSILGTHSRYPICKKIRLIRYSRSVVLLVHGRSLRRYAGHKFTTNLSFGIPTNRTDTERLNPF